MLAIADEPRVMSRGLTELETVIERGQQTFVEVGQALMEIRDGRLYRQRGYATFDEYCKERWGWHRRQAYNYIDAADVFQNVHLNAQNPPSLTQAVQLAPLPPQQQQEIASEVDFSQVSTRMLSAVIRRRKAERQAEKQEAKQAIPADLPCASDRYRLLHADIKSVELPSGSIDCIITDPPYPEAYLPFYADLARLAARTLKPQGSLLAMVGQAHLPEILALMTPHIRYHWILAYLMPGGGSMMYQRKVSVGWKPVLWFTNGIYQGDAIYDVAKSDAQDKRFHDWGQSESGMADLIERFTYPGQTILDPFLGGGTTGVVAVRMNRRFIGIDVDEAAIATSAKRLAEIP